MAYFDFKITAKDRPLQEAFQNFNFCPYQDVHFMTKNGTVSAHKFILAANSDLLKRSLRHVPAHVDACITLVDTEAEDVKLVLELLYSGCAIIPGERKLQVIELLEMLDIDFVASRSVLEDFDPLLKDKAMLNKLAYTLANVTDEQFRDLFTPEVRVKRLTTEEIAYWTKTETSDSEVKNQDQKATKRKLSETRTGNCSKRRRKDGSSLKDLTNRHHTATPGVSPVRKCITCPLCLKVFVRRGNQHVKKSCPFLRFFEVSGDFLKCRGCEELVLASNRKEHLAVCEGKDGRQLERMVESDENLCNSNSAHPSECGKEDPENENNLNLNIDNSEGESGISLSVSPLPCEKSEDSSPAEKSQSNNCPAKIKYESPLKINTRKRIKGESGDSNKVFKCKRCDQDFVSSLMLLFHRCENYQKEDSVSSPLKTTTEDLPKGNE